MLNLNAKWKKLIMIQIIGYLLAILMSPISIRIIIDERIEGVSFITFPIISFIVWGIFIVLPVVYADATKMVYKEIYLIILLFPIVTVILFLLVLILINVIMLI